MCCSYRGSTVFLKQMLPRLLYAFGSIPRFLTNLNLTILLFFHCFYGRGDFWSSLLYYFPWRTLSPFFVKDSSLCVEFHAGVLFFQHRGVIFPVSGFCFFCSGVSSHYNCCASAGNLWISHCFLRIFLQILSFCSFPEFHVSLPMACWLLVSVVWVLS